jgi:RNA polymerase sigma factor FliA
VQNSEQATTDALWREYKRTHQRRLRDELIVRYSSLVDFVAARVARGVPPMIEHADLVSYGVFGLIDAIEKFDPERHIKFETYAVSRIKGAVIDELRSVDWVPRSVRAKARLVERAFSELQGTLLRSPTDFELASDIGISDVALRKISAETFFVGVVALDEVISGRPGDGGTTLGQTLADRREGPVAAFELEETNRGLVRAINCLGERERRVLSLYYYRGMTLAEIGRVLGVTESRVCQIHGTAIGHLRGRIQSAEREVA